MFNLIKYVTLMIYICGCGSLQLHHFSNQDKADFFLNISNHMSRPYMWVRSKFAHLYSPFKLGHFGQQNSTLAEIFSRNILLETLISVAPTACVIGELSTLPRSLSYSLRDFPFDHKEGKLKNKSFDGQFTLLNMNICFLPGELPLFFGGVASAAERVSGIADLIISQDPDIVCLYEAHEVNSVYALYHKLKDSYAHFYIDIGPNFLEMNSGLFVASKYEIIDPQFMPFQYIGMQSQINKGFFVFKIVDDHRIIAKIYTTHLQPYRKNTDEEIRKAELREVIKDISRENFLQSYPTILCGDMNIPWGSEEYFQSGLHENFYDNYNKNHLIPNKNNRTFSASLGDIRWDKKGSLPIAYSEIIDYVLIYKKQKGVDITTKRVVAFDEFDVENALSDHNGLFSTIEIQAPI